MSAASIEEKGEGKFAADWLALREPFDAAARDRDLTQRFAAALGTNAPKKLLDLGAGTGANFRYLAPLIAGDQDWLLVDHDPLLLAAQISAIARWADAAHWRYEIGAGGIAVQADSGRWRVRGKALDLASALETLDLQAVDGVTTTAFLDLVSAPWLDRLADWLAAAQCPLLATLTVDGRRVWQPVLAGDALIERAFHDHQESDKGFGSALGNNASRYLAQRLRAAGYTALEADSNWLIDAAHPVMLNRMAMEAADVAEIAAPTSARAIAAWLEQRRAQIAAGAAAFTVGHQDLLGVPPGS